ncbi:MAG: UDP-N-acetylglucosamine 2-epimerase [Opitutales bacterium]|nr:UDP-N-acetylglucosamine 2-epimerase [Opitutales bacterium]
MRKICVVVGSRANYSSIKSVMLSVKRRDDLKLQVILTASALLDRYGMVANLIKEDGFEVDAEVRMLLEGESPLTMAQSTGIGLMNIPQEIERLDPDVVFTVGDRFETMSTTLATTYMNKHLAHTMGGEVTGTIDESIRHAITKFAHIHFPACEDARQRIIKMGELPEFVFNVGCPRIDLVRDYLEEEIDISHIFEKGVGSEIDLNRPYLLVSQHPVTTEYGKAEKQIWQTLSALTFFDLPAIVLWPNADAGSEDISKGIRKWRERGLAKNMHFFKNLPIQVYVKLMKHAACLIGNSSSGIREGAFIGTPVVNIGSRQNGRMRGENVLDVATEKDEIVEAVDRQLEAGCYKPSEIYGGGNAGEKIASILSDLTLPPLQKRICY